LQENAVQKTPQEMTEFEKYSAALAERGEGQVVDVQLPGECHRYHYYGRGKPLMMIVASEMEHKVVKFVPELNFN
jgi:hypothetical protein